MNFELKIWTKFSRVVSEPEIFDVDIEVGTLFLVH